MVNTCAGRTQQDASSDYFRLGFVLVCETVTARHMVPKVVQDIFRTAPAYILKKELPDIMKVLTKIGDESQLRADLLENIPNIAAQAVESSTRVAALNDVIGDYLIPLVVRNLGSSDTGADKAAQISLIQLLERGFVTKFQAEIKICPSILALTKMECQLDVKSGAVTLMSKLAPLLGRDITERIFLKRFIELCSSHLFYVRKLSASQFGHYCAIVGKDEFETTLLPCYLALCQDEIWGVRKSCAEVIIFISCKCPQDLRKSLLAPAFIKLLQDDCRWVKMSAFQTLGAFISTFSEPFQLNIGYNSFGELVVINQNGIEFQPGGFEASMNFCITNTKEEMGFKSLSETFFDPLSIIPDSDKSRNISQRYENSAYQKLQDDQSLVKMSNIHSDVNLKTADLVLDTLKLNLSSGENSSDSKNNVSSMKTSEIVDKVQHEDDLLSYNQYNYWYISPPDVKLDELLKISSVTGSGEKGDVNSLDVMTSHLEDLYATFSLNDSDDSNSNKSILCTSDNNGDHIVDTNSIVDNNDTVELKEPPQKIVPQELINNFVSMANTEKWGDIDYSFQCAYSLPAVILTLGKENWPLLKDTVNVLAGHMSYKVRRTIASSLHEIALILGPELATETLSPLFEGFLKDLDEVRIGVLRHLSTFLESINPDKRIVFLPRLFEFLKMEDACNWRFQETFADELTKAIYLFSPSDIVKHIGLYAQALMLDNVAAVRQAAMLLVTEIVKHISKDHGLAASYLSVIAERFAHSKKWKPRQTFALLCSELLRRNALDSEKFASVMLPHLLDLSWDPVANVRLVVAKCIVKNIINNDYFIDPTNEHFESLDNVLRRLQSDKDRDVRMCAEYPTV